MLSNGATDGTGDVVLPGISWIDGLELADDVEIPKAKGTAGAKVKNQGEKPAQFDIVTKIWVDPDPYTGGDQWKLWQEFVLPMIRGAKKNSDRTALEVMHPLLSVAKITKIFIHGVKFDGPKDGGVMTITLRCTEWVDYPKAVKPVTKPKSAVSEQDAWRERYDRSMAPRTVADSLPPQSQLAKDMFG